MRLELSPREACSSLRQRTVRHGEVHSLLTLHLSVFRRQRQCCFSACLLQALSWRTS